MKYRVCFLKRGVEEEEDKKGKEERGTITRRLKKIETRTNLAVVNTTLHHSRIHDISNLP
jgi:hypothetical protein